jgi:hypothetical protein
MGGNKNGGSGVGGRVQCTIARAGGIITPIDFLSRQSFRNSHCNDVLCRTSPTNLLPFGLTLVSPPSPRRKPVLWGSGDGVGKIRARNFHMQKEIIKETDTFAKNGGNRSSDYIRLTVSKCTKALLNCRSMVPESNLARGLLICLAKSLFSFRFHCGLPAKGSQILIVKQRKRKRQLNDYHTPPQQQGTPPHRKVGGQGHQKWTTLWASH